MRRLLVTGGAGFIGSNFIRYWLDNYHDDFVVNLDVLTYAGNLESLADIQNSSNYKFIRGDIRDKATVEKLLKDYQVDTVINFAAESHVDRSILGAEAFIETNVHGTFALLEAARICWAAAADHCRFLHVSTDEVYGSLGANDPAFTEASPYSPNSPYAASKAASDHLARAYFQTYELPVITTNCSNNYGPYQFPEKLIPLVIISALRGEKIPVYGTGVNVRDWLHVEDHCRGIEAALLRGLPGETYNIGGNNECTNIEIVKRICERIDARKPTKIPRSSLISFVKDRPGHDLRYAINADRIKAELGWTPQFEFETGLEQTIDWYIDNPDWWGRILDGAYRQYYERQYADIIDNPPK